MTLESVLVFVVTFAVPAAIVGGTIGQLLVLISRFGKAVVLLTWLAQFIAMALCVFWLIKIANSQINGSQGNTTIGYVLDII